MKKSFIGRFAALLFAAAMIICTFPAAVLHADNAVTSETVTAVSDDGLVYDRECFEPIPLLVIRISFDANGNGKNDYDPENPTKLINKDSDCYGEQWIYSKPNPWYTTLFDDEYKSLKNYYKEISDGKFWFYPAEETEGTANDGIIDVVINQKHPDAIYGHNEASKTRWANERVLALKAADEYIDFSKYDKDGNGDLSKQELAILFVMGGVESSSSYKGDSQKYFYNHAHYTTGGSTKLDGVKVCGNGFVRVGEYVGSERTLTVGTIAHELGHFLGAIDLYDTSKTSNKYNDCVGYMSLMASGSHGRKDGEANGQSPAHLDPYHAIKFGFCGYMPASNGEYTLYSRQSTEGKYSVIRINTPDPREYYLIENRYNISADDKMYFDSNSYDQKGIVIWHVDESVTTGNKSGVGSDPAVAILSTSSGISGSSNVAFRNSENDLDRRKQFINTNYKFPESKTWYTLLTEEQADGFTVTVNILSAASNEMKIKVNISHTAGPYASTVVTDKTMDSLTIASTIKTMNGGKFVSCGYILSEKSSFTDDEGIKAECKLDANGCFEHTFTGLASGKKYFYRVYIESDLGTTYYDGSAITLYPTVEREYATFYLCQNMPGTRGGFYGVKVYPGKTLTYSLRMRRNGYEFGGWYFNENFTGDRYDMSEVKNDKKDVYLYAKWIKSSEAAVLKFENAKPAYTVYATEVGDTFIVPVAESRAGYTFCGWYADAEYESEFDFNKPADEAGEFSIYAKWVKDGETEPETTVTTKTVTTATTAATETTATAGTTDISVSDTATTGDANTEKDGLSAPVITVIVSVVIILAAAAIVVTIKKKKSK